MSDTPRDCEHGQLARACRVCELERELAAACAELARAMKVVEAARRYKMMRDVHSGSNLCCVFEEWEAGL